MGRKNNRFWRYGNKERYNINGYWATGLIDEIPTTANIEVHAKIIYQKYRTREIIKEARKVQRNATDDSMKYKDILELVRSLSDQFLDGDSFNEFDIAQCAKEKKDEDHFIQRKRN